MWLNLRLSGLFIAMCLMCAAGCGDNKKMLPSHARKLLKTASHFELFSLDPNHHTPKEGEWGKITETRFHGWHVLGRSVITDHAEREEILAALDKGMSEGPDKGPACFYPRVAFHANDGDQSVDVLICFQCAQVELIPHDNPKPFFISNSPEALFDAALRRAGLPLAAKEYNPRELRESPLPAKE